MAFVNVGVTLHAIFIHHEHAGGNPHAAHRARPGRFKIFFTKTRAAPFTRIERVHADHEKGEQADGDAPGNAPAPTDVRPGPAVQDIDHHGSHRRDHVQDADDPARQRIHRQLRQPRKLNQGHSGQGHRDAGDEQQDAQPDCPAIGPMPGRRKVREAKDHKRSDDGDTDQHVHKNHG